MAYPAPTPMIVTSTNSVRRLNLNQRRFGLVSVMCGYRWVIGRACPGGIEKSHNRTSPGPLVASVLPSGLKVSELRKHCGAIRISTILLLATSITYSRGWGTSVFGSRPSWRWRFCDGSVLGIGAILSSAKTDASREATSGCKYQVDRRKFRRSADFRLAAQH
jgi:hypothetical protein